MPIQVKRRVPRCGVCELLHMIDVGEVLCVFGLVFLERRMLCAQVCQWDASHGQHGCPDCGVFKFGKYTPYMSITEKCVYC